MKKFPGSTRCHVEYHHSALLIKFYRGRRQYSLLLQADYDQAAFAVSCGLITAERDWDGTPSKLGEAWTNCDLTDIEYCPDEYFDLAEPDNERKDTYTKTPDWWDHLRPSQRF